IPGRGYSFVAPVQCVTAPEESTASPGLPVRRLVLFGMALATVAAAAILTVSLRHNRALPFGAVKTTRLTNGRRSIKAAISPDGRYIAHTWSASGMDSMQLRRSATLQDVEILPPAPVHFLGITFSPDSESIYYATHTESGPPVLYRIPVIGGIPQKIK